MRRGLLKQGGESCFFLLRVLGGVFAEMLTKQS